MYILKINMKNKIIKILSKPKVVISSFLLFAVIVLIFSYDYVGKAPKISFETKDTNRINVSSDSNINLSFSRSGKVKEVFATVGQKVKKGQILAKLDAPDSEGMVAQAKGALDLAEAQYMSLNTQYLTTKKTQDLIVENAYTALLNASLEAEPNEQTSNSAVISGTYTCGKEGYYIIKPYKSGDTDTGYSFSYSGIESGVSSVKYKNSVPLGSCGIQIKWNEPSSYFDDNIIWTINIPNTKGSNYLTYKNSYDLSIQNREKILQDLEVNIGKNGNENSIAKAQVNAALGAYDAALGAYQNNLIISPVDGYITFIDENLKVGQTIVATKNVINITKE